MGKKDAAVPVSDYRVSAIMTTRIVSVSPDAMVAEAALKIKQHKVGALIVLENKKTVGIISERDISNRVVCTRQNSWKTTVGSVMTTKLFSARETDTVARVLNLMLQKHIRHAPVIGPHGQLLGIVSMRDLFLKNEERLRMMVEERTRELNELNTKLERYSNIDPLTGLYNYRFFNHYLDTEIARSNRRGYMFSILMIDIDFFKQYNDVKGHEKGNALLRKVGKLLRPFHSNRSTNYIIRKSDISARVGGDEFTVILPETHKSGAYCCADRFRNAIVREGFRYDYTDPNRFVTVSIGIAEYPLDANGKKALLERADQALYKAKKLGRDQVAYFANP